MAAIRSQNHHEESGDGAAKVFVMGHPPLSRVGSSTAEFPLLTPPTRSLDDNGNATLRAHATDHELNRHSVSCGSIIWNQDIDLLQAAGKVGRLSGIHHLRRHTPESTPSPAASAAAARPRRPDPDPQSPSRTPTDSCLGYPAIAVRSRCNSR